MSSTEKESAVVTAPSARCEGCGKPSRSKCSQCKYFVYCSVKCQKMLWPRHQYVCTRIQALVVDPTVSTLFGVGDPVWEGSHRKLDSERIKHLREIGEDDPEEHPDYLVILPMPGIKRVIEYLDVKSLCRLDSVVCNVYTLMAWHEALRDTYSVALSRWPHTNENGFAGLKWAMQRRMELRDIRIWKVIDASGVQVTEKAVIFNTLCIKKKLEDVACLLVRTGWIGANDVLNTQTLSSPLDFACLNGRSDLATTLIERGADINKAMNEGTTPLFIASHKGHVEVVRILVERGADINKAEDEGYTPLWIASQKGHVEVVRILVERGADINQATNEGYTPLMIAKQFNHTEIIRLLERAQAQQSSRKKK